MEHIIQFYQELLSDQIIIRDQYIDQTREKNDVITDLNDYHKTVSVACLPIARQIVIFEKKLCLILPKLGDIFIGLLHHPVIEQVTFVINNYSEENIIEGKLQQVGQLKMWQFTDLPVVLLNIDDYNNVNIELQITLNNQYNLHTSNRDMFKAYYGYFNQSIKSILLKQTVLQIPLLNKQYHLETVCGIWAIVGEPRFPHTPLL